ncbi:MAG: hypothetical protein ACREA9_20750 [Pyrinomonadaceae bacterium]
MATKKSAKKSSAKVSASALRFKIDWIKDPMPDLRKVLDRTSIQRLAALKKDFATKANAIIKSGQR